MEEEEDRADGNEKKHKRKPHKTHTAIVKKKQNKTKQTFFFLRTTAEAVPYYDTYGAKPYKKIAVEKLRKQI